MPAALSRPRVLIASSLVAIATALSGCSALGGSKEVDDTKIAAAFYPLAYAAEQVAGDRYEVVNLTQPGVEPHDLELTVGQTANIANAALVVFHAGFQPAVDASVEQNGKGATLDSAEVVDLRPIEEHEGEGHHDEDAHHDEDEDEAHHDEDEAHEDEAHEDEAHEDEDAHDHGDSGLDPHFWQDPLLMADFGDTLADELAELDPDNATEYAANAATFRTELETLDAEFTEGLANCERDLVVVNHDAFGYLSRYGLHFEPISGLSPDAEVTAADRADIQQLIRDEGITTVFSETLAEKKTAESIAADLGVRTAVLDPLEGLTDDAGDADYLSVMRSNLAALKQANGC